MYMNKDKEVARTDRRNEIIGCITGTYMRMNHMQKCPISEPTLKEIVDYIAPAYITMTQYDYRVVKEGMKVALKSKDLTPEQRKTLRLLMKKISLFVEK